MLTILALLSARAPAQPAQPPQAQPPAAPQAQPQPAAEAPKPYDATCRRAATFHAVIDVGHTAEVPGAISARGATEYDFNMRLAKEIEKELLAAGFDKTTLMITADAPPQGLFRRVAKASEMKADLLLSIHHDSVPDQFLETWQYEGQEQHFSDRWAGHSIFVSNGNADRAGSLAFAKLLGNALEARDLHYTPHYTEKIMGNRQRVLLDPKAGVYRYDQLIVLKDSRMPAALLEAGSIINRTEEQQLATPERQMLTASAVVEAMDKFCAAKDPKRPPRPAQSSAKKH